eukprot:TRINITY_DN19689_c0_g4_i2.p2 TRINITY_DN19689_c0_g4~~TRINITY_DN19689_c0_g4_i2.p2  ORF type:complete len:100 (-),score=8.92 TRINITY_DN19689_c0_g4_i2:208-507(-)
MLLVAPSHLACLLAGAQPQSHGATVLDRVSPAEIYELASYYTCVVRDFLQAHAGDLRQVALACGRMAGNFTDLASRSASLAHQQDASCAQTTSRYGNAA